MKEYNLKLTEQEVNTILFALSQRPYIEVVELIVKIQKQAEDTINCKEE